MLRASLGQAVNEGRLIPAGYHHVRLYEEGAGSAVVVIIAGAGDCADSWVPIRHRLAAVHRVVSYDRAAIGGSDQAAPATAERYLAELDAVTDAASPQDPVILAGHSLGGLIARLYLNARPGRVSGLVLLHSTPLPRQWVMTAASRPASWRRASQRGCSSCSPRWGSPGSCSGGRRCRYTPSNPTTRRPCRLRNTTGG